MAGEEWARRIVKAVLYREVELHDDGTAPGMYDLRIGPVTDPDIAIECVGAVNSLFTETWNVGPARGPFNLSINGDWIITIEAEARIKLLKNHIAAILQHLEERQIDEIWVGYRLKRSDRLLFDNMSKLKITHANRYREFGTGKVYISMPGIGGAVDEQGNSVSEWIGVFLRKPEYEDVLLKLSKSNARERHVFVIVNFSSVPWLVESYFSSSTHSTPSKPPDLPQPITGVWIVASLGPIGLLWNGKEWLQIQTRGEGIDTEP